MEQRPTPPWLPWCLALWDPKDSGHPAQGLWLLICLGAFVHKILIVYQVMTEWWECEGPILLWRAEYKQASAAPRARLGCVPVVLSSLRPPVSHTGSITFSQVTLNRQGCMKHQPIQQSLGEHLSQECNGIECTQREATHLLAASWSASQHLRLCLEWMLQSLGLTGERK